MSFFIDKLRTAYRTAQNLHEVKKYIEPKIYHGGNAFDLSKRWYVYYSYLNPETELMTRQPNITLKVNQKFKTREERLTHFQFIKKTLLTMLKNGYSPYSKGALDIDFTVESCLDYALKIKKAEVKATTYRDYESRINQFKVFLKKLGLLNASVKELNKKNVSEFLNQFTGAKNRNNMKIALSSIYNRKNEMS